MEQSTVKYYIISPVRNEAKNIINTIESVISQTIRPIKWIIVNDGSTDETEKIVNKYIDNHDWISLINLHDRGYYDLMAGGEIKAFYEGYEQIKNKDYDFLVKVDGDVSFDLTYFEQLFSKFHLDAKLGIASGSVYYKTNNGLVYEKAYKYHVRGAARAYKRECWSDIGGTIDNLGWDAMDVYKARMLGWNTYSFKELKIIHHTITWTKGGLVHGRMRSGRMEYLIGAHPVFFFSKIVREIVKRPVSISSYAYIWGYMKSFISREQRVVDKELMSYIRKEQIVRLLNRD